MPISSSRFSRVSLVSIALVLLVFSDAEGASASSAEASRKYRVAQTFINQGDFVRLEAGCKEYIKLFPKDALRSDMEFWLGYALHRQSKNKEAERVFSRWLLRYSRHELMPKALYWRGETLTALGHHSEARSAWRELLARFEKSTRAPNALNALAWSHYRTKDYASALARYEEFLRKYPTAKLGLVIGAKRLSADCHLKLGRPKKALAIFDEILRCKSPTKVEIDVRFGRAGALRALNDDEAAVSELLLVVELLKDKKSSQDLMPEVLLMLGSSLVSMNRSKEALEVFWQLKLHPEKGSADTRALFWTGRAHELLGELEKAERVYSKALSMPEARIDHGRIAWHLAEMRYNKNDLYGAIVAYDLVVKVAEPKELVERALYNAGLTLAEAGDMEASIARINKLINQFRSSSLRPDALFAAGEFNTRLKKYNEAITEYSEFLRVAAKDPRAAEVRFRRGVCYSLTEKHHAARVDFDAYIKTGETAYLAEAAYQLAESARKAGRKREAKAAYLRVLGDKANSSRNSESLWMLSVLAREEGEVLEALAYAERIVKEYPESGIFPWAVLAVGDLALSKKQYDKAARAYKQLMQDDTANDELKLAARAGRAWVFLEQDKKEDALEAFMDLAEDGVETSHGKEATYRAAVLLRQLNRAGEAGAMLDALLASDPRGQYAQAAIVERAIAYRQKKEFKDAERLLNKFMLTFPSSAYAPAALRELALVYYETEDIKKETAVWTRLAEHYPNSAEVFDAYWGLAAINEQQNNLKDAARWYGKAASKTGRKEAVSAGMRHAACLAVTDSYRAERAYQELATRFAGGKAATEALLRAGRLALASNNVQRAEKFFEKAEATEAGSASVALAIAARQRGDAQKALSVLSKINASPYDVWSERELKLEYALALADTGNLQAIKKLNEIIAEGEDLFGARAQKAKGDMAYRAGNYRKAEAAYYELIVIYSFEDIKAETRFMLGQTNEKLRDFARAKEFYAELIRENPKSKFVSKARRRIDALSP